MGVSALGIILVALAGADAEAAPPAPTVYMWAVQASDEGREERYYTPGLDKRARKAMADLPYDTYNALRIASRPAPYQWETRFPINEKYTLIAKPISPQLDGRLRIDVRVAMAPKQAGDEPVKALDIRLVVTPGNAVKFRGLQLDEGELVIVLLAEIKEQP